MTVKDIINKLVDVDFEITSVWFIWNHSFYVYSVSVPCCLYILLHCGLYLHSFPGTRIRCPVIEMFELQYNRCPKDIYVALYSPTGGS